MQVLLTQNNETVTDLAEESANAKKSYKNAVKYLKRTLKSLIQILL